MENNENEEVEEEDVGQIREKWKIIHQHKLLAEIGMFWKMEKNWEKIRITYISI